jgi:hypothetical protein
MKVTLVFAFLLLISSSAAAETIAGRASVIDGDTLEIHGKRIRILDIDAPEARQPCIKPSGEEWRCGQQASLALADWIGTQTVTEAAAAYGEKRARERVARNPALAGLPDKEMEYIAKWVRFLRSRGVADIPLADFCQSGKRHIDAYFADLHIAKKHKLSTMHRENDSYETLMNYAVSRDISVTPLEGSESPSDTV